MAGAFRSLFMRVSRLSYGLAALLVVVVLVPQSSALADYCAGLRAQLAQLGRASRSPAQQLRSAEIQASRLGCFGGFGFFGRPPSGRCYALMGRINSLRGGSWAGGSDF